MVLNGLAEEYVVLLFAVSTVLTGLLAGLFFAYSVSVVLALDTLSASVYTIVMQEINDKILNPVFRAAFVGAVVVPVVSAAVVLFSGDWRVPYGQLFLAAVVIYLIGTVAVTMIGHIPMNEYIATWSSASPPDDWTTVRARWALWNHVRTTAALLSFVLYLGAIVSLGK